jgi:hypothetical protein
MNASVFRSLDGGEYSPTQIQGRLEDTRNGLRSPRGTSSDIKGSMGRFVTLQ